MAVIFPGSVATILASYQEILLQQSGPPARMLVDLSALLFAQSGRSPGLRLRSAYTALQEFWGYLGPESESLRRVRWSYLSPEARIWASRSSVTTSTP